MFPRSTVRWLALLSFGVKAIRWSPEHVGYNLNENRDAIDPTDYWGEWQNHTYHPSPTNWRFPFYVATIDRFVDGDPTNNEANGTVFEHNWMTNQFRFGGDVKGLEGNLDYIQGLGIKAIVSIFPAPTIPKRITRKQAKRMMPSSMLCSTTLLVVK
ncbi:MAG: hypothetical protein Q9205_001522 [Flavoplaca limonia]